MSIHSFGYLLKEGVKNIFNNRMMSLAAVGVLISCLVLTGSAVMLSVNVSEIVDSVGDKNVTTIYLDEDMSELEAVYVGKAIEKIDNVIEVTFYPKDEAIQSYREVLGDEVFKNMSGDDNPLPHAYHIVMEDLSKYDETIANIVKIEGVSSASSRSAVAEKLTSLSTLITMMSFWIIVALALISLFIIANTIRMTMYSHRFEISIMKSVGATNRFVKTPYLVEGILIGVFSAGVSIALIALLSNAVIKSISNILPFEYTPFSSIALPVSLIFILAGIVVGMIGSSLSIRRYLKHEGNDILGW